MSRSNYTEDGDNNWSLIRWRGAVTSAIKGSRGQDCLRDLITALDAMPEKELIANELQENGRTCALGALGLVRGLDLEAVDPEDSDEVAKLFGIAPALAREIVYKNDEGAWSPETAEDRWRRMRAWAVSQLRNKLTAPS